MCGRSSLHDAPSNVLERFRLPVTLPGFRPRYNIAPTQDQWAIARDDSGALRAAPMRWGLVPSWAKDASLGQRMINARAESLMDKPSFRTPFRERRCVVLADGYYEWMTCGKQKVPVHFHLAGRRAFPMAGLWDRWENGESSLETCTIITTTAGRFTSRFHHRMPVILTLEAAESWMDGTASERDLLRLLSDCEPPDIQGYEVSKLVNSPNNDLEDCIKPACVA